MTETVWGGGVIDSTPLRAQADTDRRDIGDLRGVSLDGEASGAKQAAHFSPAGGLVTDSQTPAVNGDDAHFCTRGRGHVEPLKFTEGG